MKGKRVEYQKFVRTKLEDERYRHLFGLSENVELEAEEDFVLQREFRIDFVFRKINATLLLTGIFSHFRTYNLFEFKSVNDAFDLVQLRKYLGELFWWLYIKDDEGQLQENEVTLTIMTVRKPTHVLKHLQQPHLQVGLMNESPGHYHWTVMGVSVHLLVINELDLIPEHYAWLTFAEGTMYKAYQQKLAEDVSQDETCQIYLDILNELEQEGKERMAYEVVRKLINRMPPERQEALFLDLPGGVVKKLIDKMPPERQEALLLDLPGEVVKKLIDKMPPERRDELFPVLPADVRQKLQVEAMQKMLSQLLQAKFGPLPQEVIDHVGKIASEAELSNLAQKLITASSLAELGLS